MIKVRIAPSPTGFLHVGTAQSALYNWLFARKNGGHFYLRIEDTDKARSTKEAEQSITDALTWLGINWDGELVRQSDNVSRHKSLLQQLLRDGKAFYCHHSQEELEAERKQQEEKKEAPRHICEHKHDQQMGGRDPEILGDGIIRLAVDANSERVVTFEDRIRGKIEFKASLLGDFSIARDIDDPLYNFAVVADDLEMGITHVIRGEDHISNTPKQILVYEAFGKEPPRLAHLPLVLAPDRSKLSKRHGAVSVVDYKKDYLPEALVNFLGGLSYTFSKEIISKEEMVNEFELSKVHKSGAVFDVQKLNWLNSQYIKKLSPAQFKNLTNLNVSDEAVSLITERLEKLSDAQDFDYFWKEPEYDKNLLKWKKASLEESVEALKKVQDILEKTDFDSDKLRNTLDELGKELGDRGLAYWPLRVALTGKERSPDSVDVAVVLGRDKVLERIKKAV